MIRPDRRLSGQSSRVSSRLRDNVIAGHPGRACSEPGLFPRPRPGALTQRCGVQRTSSEQAGVTTVQGLALFTFTFKLAFRRVDLCDGGFRHSTFAGVDDVAWDDVDVPSDCTFPRRRT